MDIRTLHHISLPVADLERSRRFYRDILGLEEIERPPFPFPGAWFRLGDRELHLIGGEGVAPSPAQGADPRQLHFAIRVTSFRGALERLRNQGYREDAGEGDSRRVLALPRSVVGYPQLYILDPDRHLIEINAEKLDG
jgi:catechol 2,3-dioxygenase-like lactoylglutathione lyase family enzyme